MIAKLVIFSAVAAAFISAAPLPGVPEELSELVPPEVKGFIAGLSDADKAALKEVEKNRASFKTDEDAIAALKSKAPEVGAKIEKLHNVIKAKIAALKEESAKAFAKEIVAGARKLQAQIVAGQKPSIPELKKTAAATILKFKALPAPAQAELKEQFPKLIAVFGSEKFQKFVLEN